MTQARITVTRDTIDIEELRLTDAALAAFVSETPEADRPALAERALRIGLLTLANAGVNLSADVVKAEFERLTDRMEATQKRAAEALATTCARTSPMETVACPGPSSASWATTGSCGASPATCSTRTSARARSAS